MASSTKTRAKTRCYWTLLTADLHFIYLDPALAEDLEEQNNALIGKPLLSFIHPDEVENAKVDLGKVLESRVLHGSVTRVRFSRLSRIRRLLGHTGPVSVWNDAEKIAVDENYMAVDIVINWAADGLVLCFIHAIVDLNPEDNNPVQKTDWSNWCGTPWMGPEDIQLLSSRLSLYLRPSLQPLDRVFQILEYTQDRPLLMSWPPERPNSSPGGRHFAALALRVAIGTEADSVDAKTSCTRRYKSFQQLPEQKHVESIFIPHGSIIFACHKVQEEPNPASPFTTDTSTPINNHSNSHSTMGYETATTTISPSSAFFAQQPSQSYSLPPISSAPHQYAYLPQPAQNYNKYESSSAYSGRYDQYSANGGQNQWAQSNRQGYWNHQFIDSSAPAPPSHDPYYPSHNTYGGSHNSQPTLPAADRNEIIDMDPSEIAALVPPPRRRVEHHSNFPSSNGAGSPSDNGASTDARSGRGAGRSSGNRPNGVLKCSSCKATSSPEWRKGPTGRKELCNACGLRYARSRAKKEGPTAGSYNQSNGKKRKSAANSTSSLKASSASDSHRSISATPSPSSANTSLSSSYSSVGSNMNYSPSGPPPAGMNLGMPSMMHSSGLHQPLQGLQLSYGSGRRGFPGYDQPGSDYSAGGRHDSASPQPHSQAYHKLNYPPSIPSPLSGLQMHPGVRRPSTDASDLSTSFERDTKNARERGREVREREFDEEEEAGDDDDDDEYVDVSERRKRADSRPRRAGRDREKLKKEDDKSRVVELQRREDGRARDRDYGLDRTREYPNHGRIKQDLDEDEFSRSRGILSG
ncbi:hypothetical protein C8J56DRAFT_930269 [Mycena floridula]|nr:hypothetical protein C8J56DRAFT_930269 [Mycena floridula]